MNILLIVIGASLGWVAWERAHMHPLWHLPFLIVVSFMAASLTVKLFKWIQKHSRRRMI